jgi:hypothetical protein
VHQQRREAADDSTYKVLRAVERRVLAACKEFLSDSSLVMLECHTKGCAPPKSRQGLLLPVVGAGIHMSRQSKGPWLTM